MPGLEPGISNSGLWAGSRGKSPAMTAEDLQFLLLAWALARVKAADGVFRDEIGAADFRVVCPPVSGLARELAMAAYRCGFIGSKSATPNICRKIPGAMADSGLTLSMGALARPLIR
jgi:hypothetical protein